MKKLLITILCALSLTGCVTLKGVQDMANNYFDDSTFRVSNGQTAVEDDINLFAAALVTSFDLVETDIGSNTVGTHESTYDHTLLHIDSHTIVSHSDTTATGAELETLTNGSDADLLHTHPTNATDSDLSTHAADTDAHHNASHTVASHSDTTATGAELETLTNDSMADALHRHSELSASDGAPSPALTADTSGSLSTYGQISINGLDASADKAASLFLYGTNTSLPANLCSISRTGGVGGDLWVDNGGGGDIAFILDSPGSWTFNHDVVGTALSMTATTGAPGNLVYDSGSLDQEWHIASGNWFVWNINNADEWIMTNAAFYPATDSGQSIGSSSKRTAAIWTNEILVKSSPPASAGASGTAGQIQWDANYVYICIATNTWKRTAISTW